MLQSAAIEESNVDLTGELEEHDHPAARLSGQRPVHQDPGPDLQTLVNLRDEPGRLSHGPPDLHRDDRRFRHDGAGGRGGPQHGQRHQHRLQTEMHRLRAVPVQNATMPTAPSSPTPAWPTTSPPARSAHQSPVGYGDSGQGLVGVQMPDGTEGYTRNGSSKSAPTASCRPAAACRCSASGPITLPPDVEVVIGTDGTISTGGRAPAPCNSTSTVDQLKLVNPPSRSEARRRRLFRLAGGNAAGRSCRARGLRLSRGQQRQRGRADGFDDLPGPPTKCRPGCCPPPRKWTNPPVSLLRRLKGLVLHPWSRVNKRRFAACSAPGTTLHRRMGSPMLPMN